VEAVLAGAIAQKQTGIDEVIDCRGHIGNRPCFMAFKVMGTITYLPPVL
jgi:hypothetical protein